MNQDGAIISQVAQQKRQSYLILLFLLILAFIPLNYAWQGSLFLHGLFAVASTLIVFLIGLLALVRFSSKKSSIFLAVAAIFLGSGLLEVGHLILSTPYFQSMFESSFDRMDLGWSTSRLFLAVAAILLASNRFDYRNEETLSRSFFPLVIGAALALTVLPFVIVIQPGSFAMLARPQELLAGILFLAALVLHYRKRYWQEDTFYNSFIHFLILATFSQAFMALAETHFNYAYDVANILKLTSFFVLLFGLISEYQTLFKQAERASQLKDEFLGNISHELRTPLNSILSYAEEIETEEELPDPQELVDIFKTISRNGEHLLVLINQVLDSAKLGSGKMRVHLSPTQVGPLVKGAIHDILPNAERKGLRLTFEFQDQTENLELLLDEIRIKQILFNLIGNAIKFTEEGGVKVIVSKSDQGTVFAVKDTGMGIDRKHLKMIFESFRQVDQSQARTGQGTGLGLSITKKLVELHGGTMMVGSQPNIGSTFSFTVPNR